AAGGTSCQDGLHGDDERASDGIATSVTTTASPQVSARPAADLTTTVRLLIPHRRLSLPNDCCNNESGCDTPALRGHSRTLAQARALPFGRIEPKVSVSLDPPNLRKPEPHVQRASLGVRMKDTERQGFPSCSCLLGQRADDRGSETFPLK